eukprot:4310811-Pyramimonas_sp.AAC.1
MVAGLCLHGHLSSATRRQGIPGSARRQDGTDGTCLLLHLPRRQDRKQSGTRLPLEARIQTISCAS